MHKAHFQPGSDKFTLFARQGQWITPPAGYQDLRLIPDSDKSAVSAPAGMHFYSLEEKEIMRNDSDGFLEYRKKVDSAMQATFPIFLRESPMHDMAIAMMTDIIKKRIGEGRPDLEELYIPKYSPGCRRPTVRSFPYIYASYRATDYLCISSLDQGSSSH